MGTSPHNIADNAVQFYNLISNASIFIYKTSLTVIVMCSTFLFLGYGGGEGFRSLHNPILNVRFIATTTTKLVGSIVLA